MIIPPYLKPGDKVAIVAASRKVDKVDLEFAIKTLSGWGLQPVEGKHLYAEEKQWAGTDEQRAADLQWALDDESIKAIFFARGGNGIIRIIDKLDFSKFKANPKWLVGYSDVTILHAHANKMGIASLHASMLTVYPKNADTVQSIGAALFGQFAEYNGPVHPLSRAGVASGVLVGGNISLLHTLSGTSQDIDTNGKILFIEDLDENLHHLDRMMRHFKRTGKLDKLAGLVVGGLTGMKDDEVPFGYTPEEIVMEVVREYNYPVCFGFPAGHMDLNLALVLGGNAKLTINDKSACLEFIDHNKS